MEQQSVFLFHGLTSNPEAWGPIVNELETSIPNKFKWIIPAAEKMSVSLMGGTNTPAWFDFTGLGVDDDVLEDKKSIMERVQWIHSQLDAIDGKSVIGGFSQGGMIALIAGITYPKPLGGIIALSTYLPLLKSIQNGEIQCLQARNVPILYCHGIQDETLEIKWAQKSAQVMEMAGFSNIEKHWLGDLRHTTDERTLEILKGFLTNNMHSFY
jgi:predicted esterase